MTVSEKSRQCERELSLGKWAQKFVVGDIRRGCFEAGLRKAMRQLGGLQKRMHTTLWCRGYVGFHALFPSQIEQQHLLNRAVAIEAVEHEIENECGIDKMTWRMTTQTKS